MKKIAFIIPTLNNGGAERVVSNLLINLKQDYDRYLILFDSDEIIYPYKGQILDLKTFKNKGILKFLNYFIAYFKLKKLKKEYQFDICISFLEIPSFLNILTKNKNEKVIISVRNYTSKAFKGIRASIYFPLIKILYKYSDKIVSVSEEAKKDLVEYFKINKDIVDVIYNFYDLKKIKKLATEDIEEEYREIYKKKVVINTGRLIYQKGQKFLLKGFSQIKNREEYNLVILGDGYLEEELKKEAKILKIEDRVYFIGFQNNPFKFLSRADIFVFPSRFEGFPNALAEAMACGLPIISTDCKSGPREIIGTEYGRLIENIEDEKKVVEKIKENIELLDNSNIREEYRKKSLERIEVFRKENILMKWEKMIDEI